jgi:hypothetical protein
LNANGRQVAYGGRVFNLIPELRNRIPAHFLGESIQEAMQSIETLLTSDISPEGIVPVSQQDMSLSKLFIHNRPMIDTYALTQAVKSGIPIEFSTIAIQQLGSDIASALSLGYIEALATEMEWIKGLLQEHLQSAESLGSFLSAYATAVDSVMGIEGKTISDWLRNQANNLSA